jgi:hypothetical protein
MSVHKRTAQSGAVTWVVRFRDPIPRERTFRLKGDAERFERRTIREMETGEYLDPSARRMTFGQWHDRWWPTIETSDRAPSTIAGYESSLRIQVLPYLRDVNRPGFPGGSKPWKGWSHGTRAPRIEAVPA